MAEKTSDPADAIPPEQWIVAPPSDSADYLDGEPPTYADADAELGEFAPESEAATDGGKEP